MYIISRNNYKTDKKSLLLTINYQLVDKKNRMAQKFETRHNAISDEFCLVLYKNLWKW